MVLCQNDGTHIFTEQSDNQPSGMESHPPHQYLPFPLREDHIGLAPVVADNRAAQCQCLYYVRQHVCCRHHAPFCVDNGGPESDHCQSLYTIIICSTSSWTIGETQSDP